MAGVRRRLPGGQSLAIFAALVIGLMPAACSGALRRPRHVVGVAAPVGRLWLDALTMTVVPLVFALLVTGIAGAAASAGSGAVTQRALLWFAAVLIASCALSAVHGSTAAHGMAGGSSPALAAAVHRPPWRQAADWLCGHHSAQSDQGGGGDRHGAAGGLRAAVRLCRRSDRRPLRARACWLLPRDRRNDAGDRPLGAVAGADRRVRAGFRASARASAWGPPARCSTICSWSSRAAWSTTLLVSVVAMFAGRVSPAASARGASRRRWSRSARNRRWPRCRR